VRRRLQHPLTVGRGRVAGTDEGANAGHQQPALARKLGNFCQRSLQILLDVVAEGLQRRDIEDLDAIGEVSGDGLADQTVDAGKKSSQSFSGSSGSRDQGGVAGKNVRPAFLLRLSGRTEFGGEPFLNERMRPRERCALTESFYMFTPSEFENSTAVMEERSGVPTPPFFQLSSGIH